MLAAISEEKGLLGNMIGVADVFPPHLYSPVVSRPLPISLVLVLDNSAIDKYFKIFISLLS